MRTWNNTLFFDAMPGRSKQGRPQGDFGLWLQEMAQNGIRTVVCLAPEAQIAVESPEYELWRRAQRAAANTDGTTAAQRYELLDIPVADFNAPEPFVATRFWQSAREVAERIEQGDRVFVHCGAGIGRTGMFAVAVLMQRGYAYDDAYRELHAVGSYPEVAAQVSFLQRGAPGA